MLRRTLLSLPAAAAASASPARPSGFHLGSVTYQLLQDWDLDTLLTHLEAAGFSGVELRTTHKHGIEPTISSDERKRVRERFARSKVKLVGYGTTCRFQSPDSAERKQQMDVAKQFVDLAHDTGALGVKLQPMGFAAGATREQSLAWWGDAMRALGDYGAPRKVEIWMEVHGKGTSDPPVAAAMLKAANHRNVGACWNSNDTDIVDGSVRASFDLLKPWIRHVHLHELTGTSYPYAELFGLLKAAGFAGYTMAECNQSKEAERFMPYYSALWKSMASCS